MRGPPLCPANEVAKGWSICGVSIATSFTFLETRNSAPSFDMPGDSPKYSRLSEYFWCQPVTRTTKSPSWISISVFLRSSMLISPHFFLGIWRITPFPNKHSSGISANPAPPCIIWMGAFICVPVCITIFRRFVITPCWLCFTDLYIITSSFPG